MKKFFKTAGEIIKEIATRNWGLKLIAVLLALLVWCTVVTGTNPERVKTVTDVPLRIEGTKELEARGFCVDTVLSELPDTVSVSVKAGVDYHRLITNSTVTATVNLSSIDETGEVKLNIECTSATSGSTVTAVSPSSVTLTVDKLAKKTVPVSARLTSSPRGDYYVSNVSVKNEEMTITGPETRISHVAEAVAYIDASAYAESKSISVPVTFLDADGDELENIVLHDNDRYAIADIEVLPVKEVAISSAAIQNAIINVASGYEVYGAISTPVKVRIAGDKSRLDEITDLQLELIDAQGANKSVVLDAVLKKLDDIVFVDGDKLSVYVQIREEQETITLSNLSIEVRNVPENKTAKIEDDARCTVTVTGGRTAVAALSREDIKPYVDIYGTSGSRVLASVRLDDLVGIDDDDIELSVAQVYVVLE